MGNSPNIADAPIALKQPRKVSIATFLRKYRKGKPGVKYEYNNGIIEKTESMKFSEQRIAKSIKRHFYKTDAFKKGDEMVQELEVWTSKTQWRKPDLCHITAEQIDAGLDSTESIPEFVIEFISKNDKINEVKAKVAEYFNAGVKIIWLVFPEFKTVEIYRPLKDIEVCRGEEICSAEPIIEGMNISVNDIFKK